jgi:hypothetical protein
MVVAQQPERPIAVALARHPTRRTQLDADPVVTSPG